jgi:hypothetical protein
MLTVDPQISCLLPYPSDFFNAQYWNASAPPGLTLTSAAFPVDVDGNGTDPTPGGYNNLEGGTLLGPIIAYIPGISLDLSGAPRLWNISSSVGPSATTLLLNTKTGEAVEHWVELDHSGDGKSGNAEYERALLLWPSRRLVEGTSYIVAFRNLLDDDGVPVAPSDGFAALRDKLPTSNPALEAARPQYEGLFTTLAQAGWARSSLSLAWSYTTNSVQVCACAGTGGSEGSRNHGSGPANAIHAIYFPLCRSPHHPPTECHGSLSCHARRRVCTGRTDGVQLHGRRSDRAYWYTVALLPSLSHNSPRPIAPHAASERRHGARYPRLLLRPCLRIDA